MKIHFVEKIASKRPGKIDEYAPGVDLDTARQRISHIGHTWCEALEEGMIAKLFFDRDERVDGDLTDEVINESMAIAEEKIRALFGEDHDKYEFRYATRHGFYPTWQTNKISIRVYVIGLRVKYTQIRHMIESCKQDDYWDLKVYEKKRLLACVNGIKGGTDLRVLKPETDTADITDYLVQVVDPEWPLGRFEEPAVQLSDDLRCGTDELLKSDGIKFDYDVKFAEDVLQLIEPDRWLTDYDTWRAVGFGTKDAVLTLDPDETQGIHTKLLSAFKAISRRARGYDNARAQYACEVLMRNARRRGVTFRTCMWMAKSDNPDQYQRRKHDLAMRRALILASENERARKDIHELLVAKFPDVYGDLDPDCRIYVADRKKKVFAHLPKDTVVFRSEAVAGLITQDLDVFALPSPDLSEVNMDRFVGLLSDDISTSTLMNHIHKVIPGDIREYEYNRPEKDLATLVSKDPVGKVAIKMYLRDEQCYLADINVEGKKTVQLENHGIGQKRLMMLFKCVDSMIRQHVKDKFGGELTTVLVGNNYGTVNLNVNITNQCGPMTADPNGDQNDFEMVRDTLLDHAEAHRHHKRDGTVFAPVPDCPCGFQPMCTYEEYINEVLQNDEVFHANPIRYDQLFKYLTNYKIPRMPNLVVDRNLLSFRNGVLHLTTLDFHSYESGFRGPIARNHVDAEYTGDLQTPALDVIFDAQFPREVADVLCALAGRLFFNVGELDDWQVMPYLVGVGGTGKSKILDIIKACFAKGTICYLASEREAVFGMENLADKELIVGEDMPAKLSKVLPQEMMQSMTSGEGVEVARKHKKAMNVDQWTVPVAMASNHMPDYVNTGNNVARRLATFRFDNPIMNPREELKGELQAELPNIICRFLHAYKDMRERVRAAGNFWKAVPNVMLEWQSKLGAATNKLHAFLAADDDERKCKLERVEGHVTWVTDLKKAFEVYAQCPAPDNLDPAILNTFGFKLSTGYVNCCASCKQPGKGKGEKCCANYKHDKRPKKIVVYDMMLVRQVGE